MMKIGNVELPNRVFLAPMAGVTDMPFRILCKEQGCGLVYSEMVSSRGMNHQDEKSEKLTWINEAEMPAAVQIFGNDPEGLAEAARKLSMGNAAIIDINMGCPTPKIVKNGDGSAITRNPELVGRIVNAVSKASSKPITIKIRKGWDENSVNAVEIAKIAEENGAAAIAVHGRTREQFYSGKADWEIIRAVKNAVKIPVIGNGDVFSAEDAKKLFETTGCDAIMVGRGAQGNPWIFNQIIRYLDYGELPKEVPIEVKFDAILRHMDMLIELKGERTGLLEMRSHIAWYIKGIRNATKIKERIFKINDKAQMTAELAEMLQKTN